MYYMMYYDIFLYYFYEISMKFLLMTESFKETSLNDGNISRNILLLTTRMSHPNLNRIELSSLIDLSLLEEKSSGPYQDQIQL